MPSSRVWQECRPQTRPSEDLHGKQTSGHCPFLPQVSRRQATSLSNLSLYNKPQLPSSLHRPHGGAVGGEPPENLGTLLWPRPHNSGVRGGRNEASPPASNHNRCQPTRLAQDSSSLTPGACWFTSQDCPHRMDRYLFPGTSLH